MPAALSTPIRSGRAAVAILLALFVVGCQGRGDVAGKVAYQQRALASGTVLLVASDGSIHQGNIQLDGTYLVRGVPSGDARLAVNSPDPSAPLVRKAALPIPDPATVQRNAAIKAKWFPIPKKYGDPNTSGLKLSVNRGPNPHDIDLE